MFSFTKKIMIAACVVAFYSGQFYAFGSDSSDESDSVVARQSMITPVTKSVQHQAQQLEARVQVWQRELQQVGGRKARQRSRKAHLTSLIAETQEDLKSIYKRYRRQPTTSIANLPSELLTEIFELIASSGGSNPRILSLVCSDWRACFYDSGSDKDKEASWYSRMNPYGKKLMKIWWLSTIGDYDSCYDEIYERFLNGKLQYRFSPNSDDGMIELPISGLSNPFNGTFDLSNCGDAAEHLVITTNLSDFFAMHTGKLVVGIFPHWLEKRKISTTASPFSDIMEKWDEPIGIFWRLGIWSNTCFDYLTRSTLADITSRNLYENWVAADLAPHFPVVNYEYTLYNPHSLHTFHHRKFHVCF